MKNDLVMGAELKKSCMAFQLKDGRIFLISKEDVEEISSKIITEMLVQQNNFVYMIRDSNVEKSNLLYKIVLDQGSKMSEEIRANYLKVILALMESPDYEMIQWKKEVERINEKNKK